MNLFQRLGNDITHPFGMGQPQQAPRPAPIRTPAPGMRPQQQIARTAPMPPQAPAAPHMNLFQRFGNTLHNDVVAPIQRDIVHPIQQAPRAFDQAAVRSPLGRGAQAATLGIAQAGVEGAQGIAGLTDALNHRLGTYQGQSPMSRGLTNIAKNVDVTAKAEHSNPLLYHGSQVGANVLGGLIGGAASDAVKAGAAFPKLGAAVNIASKLNPEAKIANAVAGKTAGLAEKGLPGRIAANSIRNIASPKYQAGNAAFTALQSGQQIAQGRKVTPGNVATNLAIGAVGLPVAGAVGKEAAAPVIKGAQTSLQIAKNLGLKPPTNLNDSELSSARKILSARKGLTDSSGLTVQDTHNFHNAQIKLGAKPGTPDGMNAISNALDAHHAFNQQVQQRVQSLNAVKQGALKFAQDHPIGMTSGAVDESGNKLGLDGKPLNVPTPKADPQAGLKQEALKYKSAGEFANNNYQKRGLNLPIDRSKLTAPTSSSKWHQQLDSAQHDSLKNLYNQAHAEAKTPGTPVSQPAASSAGTKQRGLTTGIKGSNEFTPELQKSVTSSYQPFTNKAATATTGEFMKQPHEAAFKQMMQTLSEGQGKHVPGASGNVGVKFGKQEVSNAGALMKALDQKGDHAGAQAIHDALSEKLTNAGQTVQATQLIYNRTPDGLANMARKTLSDAGVKPSADLRAKMDAGIQAIKNTKDGTKANDLARKQYDKLVGSQLPTSTGNKLLSLYKTGILSSPKTAVKVLGAGIPNMLVEHVADTAAAPFDKVISHFTDERKVTAPGVKTAIAEAKALPGALSDAKTRFAKDIAMSGSTSLGNAELSGTNARPHGANFGVAKDGGRTKLDKLTGGKSSAILNGYTSSIGRVHGAFQTVPYEMRAAGSLTQSAVAEAKNRGLQGAEKNAFIKDFTAHPENYGKVGKQAMQTAQESAQYATGQQHTALGEAASGLQRTLPGGQIIAPITRIPGAFATQLINYSPAGYVKSAGKAILDKKAGSGFDQQALSRGLGRATVGSGLFAGGAALAATGRTTGAYPKDKATQQLYTSANVPANSVYVGGKAYPNEPWRNSGGTWQQISSPGGPAAQAALTGGATLNGYKTGGTQGAVLAGTQGGAQIVLNQPYLTGISGAMGAVNTPAQAKSFLDQTAGSVVPNFVRDTATSTDPLQRQTSVQSPITSMKNSVTNGIPGLREKNQPQVDVFGNALARNNGVLNAALNPLNPQKSTPSALTNAMGAIHNNQDVNGKALSIPTQIAKKYPITEAGGKKVALSDAQRTQFIKQSGQASQAQLNKLINSSTFKNATPAQQSASVNDVVSGQRDLAKSQVANSTVKLTAAGKAAKDGNLPTLGTDGKVHVGGTSDLNANTTASDAKILKQYASMSSSDRTKAAYSNNGFDYQYAQAKYNNDKANGTLSKAANIKALAALNKDKIGADYSKDVRDLYDVNKSDLATYLSTSEPGVDKQKIASDLLAYDKALHDAGVTSSLKYKNGIASSGSGGSGRRSSGGRTASIGKAPAISYSGTSKLTNASLSAIRKSNGTRVRGGKVALKGMKSRLPSAPKIARSKRTSGVIV